MITSGGTPTRDNSSYFGGDIPWVKMTDLKSEYIFDTKEKITKDGLENSSAKLFPKGTILIAMYTFDLGKTAILGIDAATNQAICGLQCNKEIIPKFLYYFLKSQENKIKKLGRGGAQPNINQSNIKSLEIILPQIELQKKIVQKLDNIFKKLEANKKTIFEPQTNLINTIPDLISLIREDSLEKGFSGKLTPKDHYPLPKEIMKKIQALNLDSKNKKIALNSDLKINHPFTIPKNWIWVKMINLIENMKNGLYKPSSFYGPGTPCLRMYNIDDGKIVWKNVKEMILDNKEIEEYGLHENDILLNRVNSRELVAKSAVIPKGLGPVIFESKNIRIRIKKEFVEPSFVNYYLRTKRMRNQIELECKKTCGMATVSQSDIASWLFPLPSLQEQREILRKINEIMVVIDILKQKQQKTIASKEEFEKHLNLLNNMILNVAFSGRLVN